MTTELETRPAELTGEGTVLDRPWLVFLWNDPVTSMDEVTRVLMKIFGYGRDQAELLMITAHLEGKAVVWAGDRDTAEHYCDQLGRHGLQSTVGKDT